MPGNQNHKSVVACAFVCILLLGHNMAHTQISSRPDLIQSPISDKIPVNNQNWEISQDPVTGYMYFANSKGLIEFNGLGSRLFTMPFRQGLRSVYVNHEGKIFTGAFESFGLWTHNSRGDLEYTDYSAKTNVPKNDEIWNIFEENGIVYFQSFTTIYAFRDSKVIPVRAPGIMLFMFRAKHGFIVQVLGQGLYYFNGSDFSFIKGSGIFASLEVLAIVDRPGEEYWICTAKDGIYRIINNSFIPWNSAISAFLKHQTCNAGLAINDSLIAFGTILSGLVFCDNNGKIVQTCHYANGLNNNTVLSLYKDAKGDLWAGLDEGANHLSLSSPYRLFNDKNGSLGTIYTVYRRNNLLYLGTNHGLFVADIVLKADGYEFNSLNLIPGTQGQVWKLFEYGDRLLCGHNDGTWLVQGRNIEKISSVTGGWSFAGYGDLLLQGTYTGIVTFSRNTKGDWEFRNRIQGFSEPVRYLETDYLGYLWAVHPQKGLYRLELNETADSVVNSLYFGSVDEPSGKLSAASVNNQVIFMTSLNMYSFDPGKNTFSAIGSLDQGLGEYKKSTQIIHHEKNSYWFMLENKIALFDISKSFEATKVQELLQKYIDLPGREQQIITLDRKTLLIPTRQAFTLFDLNSGSKSNRNNPPVIARIVFSGKTETRVIIPENNESISVPNRMNNLTVYLADPTAYGRGETEILYRISELDQSWHHTILDHLDFLHLKFGTYHLQVMSLTSAGYSEAEFTINHPWFLSNLAIAGYIAGLFGLVILGIKIFRIELNRHRQIIEYEVRKNKLENELDFKSYELMLTMRYLIRKTEILQELKAQVDSLKEESSKYPVKFVREMERIIREGLDSQTEEWKSAMSNLKLSHEGFFRRLKEKFPDLTPNDLRLCSYLRMNFSTKEIAHLLNISGRAVEIGRYRLRLKMKLDHKMNLTEYLIGEAEKA